MSRTIISSIVMLAMVLSSIMGTAVAADPVTMAQVYAYAKAGNLQALSSLKKGGHSLETIDRYGNTAVCRSVWMKDYHTFHILKQSGASVSAPCISKIPVEKIKGFNTSYAQWAKKVNAEKAVSVKSGMITKISVCMPSLLSSLKTTRVSI